MWARPARNVPSGDDHAGRADDQSRNTVTASAIAVTIHAAGAGTATTVSHTTATSITPCAHHRSGTPSRSA